MTVRVTDKDRVAASGKEQWKQAETHVVVRQQVVEAKTQRGGEAER